MSVIFRTTPSSRPFVFNSLGTNWKQDSVFRPKGYPFYHYLQTERGEGTIMTPQGSFLLREGEGVLLAPFLRHSYEKTSDRWLTSFASFTGNAESHIPQLLGNHPIIRTGQEHSARISSLIRECLTKSGKNPADESDLSVECYRLLLIFADRARGLGSGSDPLYRTYIEPVIHKIEQDFSLPVTVEELSSLVFISPQYLTRLFRRFLGCTTIEYLTSFRISRAKELLVTRVHLPVQEIAHMTGFSDASHFTAVFKKITGYTPLEFRKTN